MASQEEIDKKEAEECEWCGKGFNPNTSHHFIPTCDYGFRAHKRTMNSLCMFVPEDQHRCRFFKQKE